MATIGPPNPNAISNLEHVPETGTCRGTGRGTGRCILRLLASWEPSPALCGPYDAAGSFLALARIRRMRRPLLCSAITATPVSLGTIDVRRSSPEVSLVFLFAFLTLRYIRRRDQGSSAARHGDTSTGWPGVPCGRRCALTRPNTSVPCRPPGRPPASAIADDSAFSPGNIV